jgi:glycosyltransferase involved in cell wall biosynthesis
MPQPPWRVTVVTNLLPPYRRALYTRLQQRPEIAQLQLLLLARSSQRRYPWAIPPSADGLQTSVLPGISVQGATEWVLHLNWGIAARLRSSAPDLLVLSNYDAPAYWRALLWARRRCPTVLLFESFAGSSTYRQGLIAALKRFFLRRVDAVAAFGTQAAQWAHALGVPTERIVTGINTVDMEWYRTQALRWESSAELQRARERYPVEGLLLYAGRLLPHKNVAAVLHALAFAGTPELGLLIVGTGPEQPALQELCRRLGIAQRVWFLPPQPPEQLPFYYVLADALVLPSRIEPWGLVVNEALACGMYVLCSRRAGAAYDLIQPGWNGELFDPDVPEELAHHLRALPAQLPALRARREQIRQHACSTFSLEQLVDTMCRAFALASQSR